MTKSILNYSFIWNELHVKKYHKPWAILEVSIFNSYLEKITTGYDGKNSLRFKKIDEYVAERILYVFSSFNQFKSYMKNFFCHSIF